MTFEFVRIVEDTDWSLMGIIPNDNESVPISEAETVPEVVMVSAPEVEETAINDLNISLAGMFNLESYRDPFKMVTPVSALPSTPKEEPLVLTTVPVSNHFNLTSKSSMKNRLMVGFGK